MPAFLQELRQHCRRRLVERSAAGNTQYCRPLAKRRQGSREQNPAVSPPAILSLFLDGSRGVVGKVINESVDRFCDQDALFVS
jgi:hypothetical protein